MTERFKKAYDSLVRAFFEGTLAKATCTACACGNIIFDAIGKPVTKRDMLEMLRSFGPSLTMKEKDAYDLWANKRSFKEGKWVPAERHEGEINAAGYTTEEFCLIETAFESNAKISYYYYPFRSEQEILEDQYKGLCAVVDVLMQLDGEAPEGEEFKQKFREHPKLLTA